MVATNTTEVLEAATGKPIIFMPARHDHHRVQTGDGYAAYVAGALAGVEIGVTTDAQSSWWGGRGLGTVPHALIAAYGGNTVLAATKFAEWAPPDFNIVVLVEPASLAPSFAVLLQGVRAVLPIDVSPEQLVAALQAAASGLLVLHPAQVAAQVTANGFASAPARSRELNELAEPLTPRESEVLQMLAGGLVNKEIAAKLAISEHTVKFHVASILGKLGAATRTEAVSVGIRRGLVLL